VAFRPSPHVVLVKTDRLPVMRSQKYNLIPIGQRSRHQFVALFNIDAIIPRCITCEKSFTSVFFTVRCA